MSWYQPAAVECTGNRRITSRGIDTSSAGHYQQKNDSFLFPSSAGRAELSGRLEMGIATEKSADRGKIFDALFYKSWSPVE